MVASSTDIANRALSKLGDMRITSFTDPTKSAALVASMYDTVLDSETQAHSWNFAKDRVMLTPDADPPAFGFRFRYTLPAACLRVLVAGRWPQPDMSVYIQGDDSQYSIEGNRLLTNIGPTLNLLYLKRGVDPELYPPTFVEMLACRLAMEMCESLTGSNSKRDLAAKEYQAALAQARRINAISLPPVRAQDDTWMLAHQLGVF